MQEQLVKYDITDAAIAEMESLYMGLTITDLEDKEQFESVHSARMVIKGKRVEVEKTRKGLKADALAWGKKVDTEAKRIFGKLEPIEFHLMTEEQKVLDEIKRKQEEHEAKEKQTIQNRIDALLEYEVTLPYLEVASMTDDEFQNRYQKAEEYYFAEKARLENEERIKKEALETERLEREAEKKRIADRMLEIEAKQREQDEEAERQAKAQAKIDEDIRKINEVTAKLEADKKAEQDAKDKADRKAAIKLDDERLAKEAEEYAERVKPDKIKLLEFAEQIKELQGPSIKDDYVGTILDEALSQLTKTAVWLKTECDKL